MYQDPEIGAYYDPEWDDVEQHTEDGWLYVESGLSWKRTLACLACVALLVGAGWAWAYTHDPGPSRYWQAPTGDCWRVEALSWSRIDCPPGTAWNHQVKTREGTYACLSRAGLAECVKAQEGRRGAGRIVQ